MEPLANDKQQSCTCPLALYENLSAARKCPELGRVCDETSNSAPVNLSRKQRTNQCLGSDCVVQPVKSQRHSGTQTSFNTGVKPGKDNAMAASHSRHQN